MRASRSAGHADVGDHFAFGHGATQCGAESGQVTKSGGNAVAMVDNQKVAIVRFPASENYHAVRRRVNGCAVHSLNVESKVGFRIATERIRPRPESAADVTL